MKSGTLWLDYDVGDDEEHYEAKVSRAVFRDNEVSIEFSGHDPDDGNFHGNCRITGSGGAYSGPGTFSSRGESYESMVSVTVTSEQGVTELSGTWLMVGDSHPYILTIELEDS
jgi:hypothetical protein